MTATLRSTRPRAGWRPTLVALLAGATTAALVVRWAVSAEWLVVRGVAAGGFLLVIGLLVGSTGVVGLASLPLLSGVVLGFDHPAGHAWGQTLLVAILWYLTTEAAWASVEARGDTVRSPAVGRRRLEEVAAVVVVAVVVGLAGAGLAEVAPPRTAVVKVSAVAVALIGLTALARHLATQAAGPGQPPAGGTEP